MKMVEKSLTNQLLEHENLNRNYSVARLVERVLDRNEGVLTSTGAVTATTGKYTGRSPKDKFIVKDEITEDTIDWGPVNQPIDEASFDKLHEKVVNYLMEKDELYQFQGYAGADEKYRLPIQVINEYAWHNLFARQLFITPTEEELKTHQAEFTVISAPDFKADPAEDGTNSETFIIISFKKRVVLIGGTEYAGKLKIDLLCNELSAASTRCSIDALLSERWSRG